MKMLKQIYGLLSDKDRKRGVWIALSVLLRALLDFAGIAALIPVLSFLMTHLFISGGQVLELQL